MYHTTINRTEQQRKNCKKKNEGTTERERERARERASLWAKGRERDVLRVTIFFQFYQFYKINLYLYINI